MWTNFYLQTIKSVILMNLISTIDVNQFLFTNQSRNKVYFKCYLPYSLILELNLFKCLFW